MWLITMLFATFGLFGLGQKWSNDNSAAPDPVMAVLEEIQSEVRGLNTRVTALEEKD